MLREYISSGLASADVMLMDSLYNAMFTCAQLMEYTVEDREMEGESFSVEVFPGNDYQPETAFYYDGSGTLRCCVEAPPLFLILRAGSLCRLR